MALDGDGGQLHDSAALSPPQERTAGYRWTRGWVGSTAGLDGCCSIRRALQLVTCSIRRALQLVTCSIRRPLQLVTCSIRRTFNTTEKLVTEVSASSNCIVLRKKLCYITGYKTFHFTPFLIYFRTFFQSYGIPHSVNLFALHAPYSKFCKDGLMIVNWPKHVKIKIIYIYLYVYIYVYIYMCVYIYVYCCVWLKPELFFVLNCRCFRRSIFAHLSDYERTCAPILFF